MVGVMATLTVKQVAESEQISERQAQRYCRAPGYKGHVLKAVRVGRSFIIAVEDYKSWRLECGFDFLPQQDATARAEVPVPDPEPVSPRDTRPSYPAYPQCADPNGVLTNVPHEHSRNMPHPQACADYFAEQARKMEAKLRGYDND
jgi:hypothetical protein